MKFIFKLNEYPFDEMNKRERDNLVNALRDELAKLTWREIAWTVWGNVCISLMVKDEFYLTILLCMNLQMPCASISTSKRLINCKKEIV